MTKSTRSATILMLSLGVLLLAGTSRARTRPPIVDELAKTYGLDSFGQLDAIRYTFNLELPDLKVNLSRTWTWEPKTGQVTYESKDKDGKPVRVSYVRSQIDRKSTRLNSSHGYISYAVFCLKKKQFFFHIRPLTHRY